MKKILKIGVCAMIVALSAHTVAEEFGGGQTAARVPSSTNMVAEQSGGGQIVAKVSTMGLGIEYNHPVNSVFSIGFGVNKLGNQTFNSTDVTGNKVNYNGTVDLESASLLFNYHPWSNGLRLRAGAYYNNNRVNLTGTSSTGDITLNGVTFTGADIRLEANVTFKKFAPYFGIGYGSKPIGDNSFSFDLDIGVIQSPAKAQLNGNCFVGGVQSVGICQTANFDAQLVDEQRRLDAEIDYDFYPVVSLGLSYRF